MKHQWSGYTEPNTANGPGESYVTCDNCGAERHDENADAECICKVDLEEMRQHARDLHFMCISSDMLALCDEVERLRGVVEVAKSINLLPPRLAAAIAKAEGRT